MNIKKKLTISLFSIITPFFIVIILFILWTVRINNLKDFNYSAEVSISITYKIKYFTWKLLYSFENRDVIYDEWVRAVEEMRTQNLLLKELGDKLLKKELSNKLIETLKLWELADKEIIIAKNQYNKIVNGEHVDYFHFYSIYDAYNSGYFDFDNDFFNNLYFMIKGISALELYGDSFTDKISEIYNEIHGYYKKQIKIVFLLLLVISLFIIIGAVFVVFIFSNNLSNRILKIKKGIEKIVNSKKYFMKEDLTDDEVGALSRYSKQIMLLMNDKNMKLENSLKIVEKAQNKLVESEKMAALGRLVAGLAHEINTPLGITLTAITFLQDEIKKIQKDIPADDFMKSANNINDSCELAYKNIIRASDLIRSFKRVSVDQMTEELMIINLKDYLYDVMTSLVSVVNKEGHSYDIEYQDEILINTYPGFIAQIITNLVINSCKYGFKDKKGEISIKISKTETDVLIEFKDNGIGIEALDLKHIFEPFYTNGNDLGGTGLGLYLVYNIITQKLNGKIECESSVGHGTVFFITLPILKIK